jgi:excisionase family DNA binding protein
MRRCCLVQVSVRQAAERLSISQQRVRALAANGRIPARKIGRDWVVDLARMREFGERGRGRPLSARSCWAILDVLDGEQPVGFSRSELARARTRAESLSDCAPGALSARAEVHRVVAHRGLTERLTKDRRIVLSGVSAAVAHRARLTALGAVEGYVRADDLAALIDEYALAQPSPGVGANVLLRVPVPRWPFEEGERLASLPVVAVDLIDAGDEGSVRAGRGLLAVGALTSPIPRYDTVDTDFVTPRG